MPAFIIRVNSREDSPEGLVINGLLSIKGEDSNRDSGLFDPKLDDLCVSISPNTKVPPSLVPAIAESAKFINYVEGWVVSSLHPILISLSSIPITWDYEANTQYSNEDLYSEGEDVTDVLGLN